MTAKPEEEDMQTITHQDYLRQRVSSPRTVYETPGHVLEDQNLTVSQKRQVLTAWKDEEELLATATEESMGGGRAPNIQEVEEALLALTKKDA